jgi:hypothetical protein
LSLFDEILASSEDIDIPASIKRYADHEVAMLRLLHGVDTSAALKATLSDTPPDTDLASARVAFSFKDGFSTDLPPLEREHSFRRPEKALFVKQIKIRSGARKKRNIFGKALFFLLVLILLWVLAGALMKYGYLPAVDLGYGWFSRIAAPFLRPGA